MQRVLHPNEPPIPIASQKYVDAKQLISDYEQIILRGLAFDLHVEHPYKYLLNYMKYLKCDSKFAQLAWSIVNDSFYTTLCLRYKPNEIAVSAMDITSRLLNVKLLDRWYTIFGVKDVKVIEDISLEILQIYKS